MRISRRLFALTFTIGTACSGNGPTVPAPVDHDVQGTWEDSRDVPLNPGNVFLLSLSESGGVVVGTGSYAGEAGPQGLLSASGTVAHDTLRLNIVFTPDPVLLPQARPDTAGFVGRLTSSDQIDGMLTVGTATSALDLVRLPIINDPH